MPLIPSRLNKSDRIQAAIFKPWAYSVHQLPGGNKGTYSIVPRRYQIPRCFLSTVFMGKSTLNLTMCSPLTVGGRTRAFGFRCGERCNMQEGFSSILTVTASSICSHSGTASSRVDFDNMLLSR